MSLTGTCWRARPSPVLLREPLAWKLLASTASSSWSSMHSRARLSRQASCKPAAHTHVHSQLHHRAGDTPARSCSVPQVPEPFGCCSACWSRASVSRDGPACSFLLTPLSPSPFSECCAVFFVSGLLPRAPSLLVGKTWTLLGEYGRRGCALNAWGASSALPMGCLVVAGDLEQLESAWLRHPAKHL